MSWHGSNSSWKFFASLFGSKRSSGPTPEPDRTDSATTADEVTILKAPEAEPNLDATLIFDPKSDAHQPPRKPSRIDGVVVPGYDILSELGRGGMGVVYKARDQKLQRLVALKMILAGVHAGDEGQARFRAEAKAVAHLQHANIVQVFEIGEHEGRPYFSLELIDGGSLEQRARKSAPPPKGAAYLVEALARAIEFAHQHGIVHRDLKPANILLASSSGQSSVIQNAQASGVSLGGDHWSRTVIPKITDFGLAKRVDDRSAGQTTTGTIVGTPSYMSPEQASGKVREVGPASDIYSLGVILYELLVGRPPFRANNPIDVIHQVIDQEPVPPSQLEPRVPYDLETICLKCLQKEPSRRYLTAAELADDLHRYLHQEPILARPVSTTERVWKWAKRRPAIVALLGVSTAAVVGMVLFIVWHNVSLRDQLDAALDEERKGRLRIEEAMARERAAEIQSEAQQLIDSARLAEAANDLLTARLELTKALTVIRSESKLDVLKRPAEKLLAEVENKLSNETAQRASQSRFEKFSSLRDEAQFLGSLYTGMELTANLKAAHEAVQQALAVYDITISDEASPRSQPPKSFDANLSEAQQTQLRGDCYQLLLILAETESLLVSNQKDEQATQLREALRLLDQALRFGIPSRAYHLRRARYLSQLGDEAGAAQAELAAKDTEVADVLDHFLMADEFYRRADFDAAIQEFELVLHRKPDHFWAQYLNGLCLLRLNRHAEAKTTLTACLARGREFVWLYLLRGFANGELSAWNAAESDFEKALTLPLDENSRYVLFVNRGVLRIKQDRFEEAIFDLQAAINLKPTGYQAFVNLAQAYRRLDDLDAALRQLNVAIEHEPSVAHLYRLRARLRLERNESDRALGDFDAAIERDESNSPFRVEDLVERGRLLLRASNHAASLESFDAALSLRKEHAVAQRLRAESLFHLGRFEDVVTAFDRYLETGEPLESVYRGRGLAKSELGKYPGAIEDFTKALELQPTSAVQAYRGWMHVVCDAQKLAERDFELAIELDRQNADALTGRGFVRALARQSREAIADAEAALQLGPRTPRLIYNAARIYAQAGGDDDSHAFELISEALLLMPEKQRLAFWSNQVRTDAALLSLRNKPRFIEFEKEVLSKK